MLESLWSGLVREPLTPNQQWAVSLAVLVVAGLYYLAGYRHGKRRDHS